ncbi:MAG: 2-oxoglutarate dehydrogenase [Ruminococcaceae bacterium]|nr:2-oxoglutarate dehydrogenase [Oscillospiraceae bacterium]
MVEMFGNRYDGRRVRGMSPHMRIIPFIMKTRTDSMNMFSDDLPCEALDAYIKQKREEGYDLNYMKLMIAMIVRVIALRPALNRFVFNGKIYTRKKIWISFAIPSSLRDENGNTTVKLEFDGTETVFEIAETVQKAIDKVQKKDGETKSDALAGLVMKVPGFLVKGVVAFLTFLDRHEMMPKAVIEASPFHTSVFLTNMKSLGINSIYHHVYEFGTTGLFVAMGKERKKPTYDRHGEIVQSKLMPMGVVMDERFCDGLYFARSLKIFQKLLMDPSQLEIPLEAKVEDIP